MKIGFSWWNPQHMSSSIYLGTHRKDWLTIARTLATELEGASTILDVGTGDGHTTSQILGRIRGEFLCDLIEPDKKGLTIAQERLAQYAIRNTYAKPVEEVLQNTTKQWDAILAVHSNYYWGADNTEQQQTIDALVNHLTPQGKLVILTAPRNGDYFQITDNPFADMTYAEDTAEYLRKKGLDVQVKKLRQRYFVADAFDHDQTAQGLYEFFHNTTKNASAKDLEAFKKKLTRVESNGYVEFRDTLVVARKYENVPGQI